MNARESNEQAWTRRLQKARADAPPPVDVAALLRTVRMAGGAAPRGAWAEFAALLTSPSMGTACVAGLAVLVGVGSWQLWSIWQLLPWVEFAAGVGGGR